MKQESGSRERQGDTQRNSSVWQCIEDFEEDICKQEWRRTSDLRVLCGCQSINQSIRFYFRQQTSIL